MVIKDLTLPNIGAVLTGFVGAESDKTLLISNEPIAIDLAGVQFLMVYHRENNVKVNVQLNESSLELLMKTGFQGFINGDKFVLQ